MTNARRLTILKYLKDSILAKGDNFVKKYVYLSRYYYLNIYLYCQHHNDNPIKAQYESIN